MVKPNNLMSLKSNPLCSRCDFHKFFYSKNANVKLKEAYALDVPEGRDHLTKKTMEALRISFRFYRYKKRFFV